MARRDESNWESVIQSAKRKFDTFMLFRCSEWQHCNQEVAIHLMIGKANLFLH